MVSKVRYSALGTKVLSFFLPDLSADPGTAFASVIIFIKTLRPPLNTCHQLLNSTGYSGTLASFGDVVAERKK